MTDRGFERKARLRRPLRMTAKANGATDAKYSVIGVAFAEKSPGS